jgi:hypothetical protein
VAQEAEETAALDNLLEKLRNGDNVGRRARRTRPSAASMSTREPPLLQASGQGQGRVARFGVRGYYGGHCARHAGATQDERFRV